MVGNVPASATVNTPPEKRMRGNVGFKSTKSGVGAQFLLLCCKTKAHRKGVFFP